MLQKISIDDMKHSYRAGGKTFRRLCMALYYASAGHKVYYQTHKPLTDWYFNHAKDIAGSFLSPDSLEANRARGRLDIKDAGFVQFVNEHWEPRGLSGFLIEDD